MVSDSCFEDSIGSFLSEDNPKEDKMPGRCAVLESCLVPAKAEVGSLSVRAVDLYMTLIFLDCREANVVLFRSVEV
jgi:hypothetical protein